MGEQWYICNIPATLRGAFEVPLAHDPLSSSTRRQFLAAGSLALLHGGIVSAQGGQTAGQQTPATPGAPPAFGTAPAMGPAVNAQTFAEAEKLIQIEMTPKDRAEVAGNWRNSMAALLERRTGPRKLALGEADVPATVWNPSLRSAGERTDGPQRRNLTVGGLLETRPLPKSDTEIAFAPVSCQAEWLRTRALTSTRLTQIYLARLKRYDPQLRCVITLTEEHALRQAKQADAEIAAGKYRGPLHGIPYGAKDLLDTAGIATTWGAEPYRDRVPQTDAAVIRKLNEAGAVLVAKLSLGALALNDVWFGGQTKNPWLPEEGSSGSSAGPGSAVSAGLVSFAIGSETQGSILSPSMRCGVTGLRPTFGRVPRTGAMTLSWTCDKLGPMARSVADTMLVLQTISGVDPGDVASVDAPLSFDVSTNIESIRIGYVPKWMKEDPATDVDRKALEAVRQLGMKPVEVSLPDWPYDSLNVILFAEAAAAFEEITLDHRVDQLKMQVPDAWPNSFRQARFLSAVDLVQADRLRRKVAVEMARVMSEVDLLLVPSLRDEMMVISNFTGHPALCLPAGFVEVSETRSDWAPGSMPVVKLTPPRRVPHGITLVGRLFEEGTMVRAGLALQETFKMTENHPANFS